MTARTPESLGTEPRAFLRSNGTLHHNNGSAVEGDMALYDALQVVRFIDAAVSRARAAWMADGYSWPTCDARLDDNPTGPACTRTDPHQRHKGCTYASSDAPDRHDQTEAAQEG